MKKITVILLIFTILFFGMVNCFSDKTKDKTITISGAFASYPLVVKWAEEYQKINPDVTFNISAGGAGKGMTDALAKTVDLGMFSKSISQEEIDKGCWFVGMAIDAVVPTINSNNPYKSLILKRGLTNEEFINIFINEKYKSWNEVLGINGNISINIYTRSDACGAADTWAAYLGKKKQEDLKGTAIYGDPGLADVVAKDINGIGFNNICYVYDIKTGLKRPNIEVIPIDINNNGKVDIEEEFYDNFENILNAIKIGVYPSPPSRELYLVSNNKPEKEVVIDFLKWCLTDGQKYVTEAGYVQLKDEKINFYLKSLK